MTRLGHGAKFSRKMEEAVAAVLTQKNLEEAARSVGIGTATLLGWQKMSEFKAALRPARRDAYSAIGRLQQATSAAVSTLLKTMVDPGSSPSTKVRAADSVLSHAAKAIELEDIEA